MPKKKEKLYVCDGDGYAPVEMEPEYQKIIDEQKKKWIKKAIQKPGALRKQLKVKKGKTIPTKKLAKAAKAKGKLGKRARLAKALKKLKKG